MALSLLAGGFSAHRAKSEHSHGCALNPQEGSKTMTTKAPNQDPGQTQSQNPASQVILPEAWFFKSWDPDDGQLLSRLIARGSAAAPTYFNNTRFGKQFRSVVDGGFAANAPGMSAMAEAIKVSKPGDDFLAVVLGTGYPNKKYPYWSLRFRPNWLYIQPALEMYGIMMSQVVYYQLDTILNIQMPNSIQHAGIDPKSRPRIRLLNLDAQMSAKMFSIDNIDPANVQAEIDLAYRTVEANQADVEKMVTELVRCYHARTAAVPSDHTVWPFVANTGGGARGIFTAALMDILSQMSGLHPTQMFWLNSGNSAGSLNTMLQTAPNPDGSPRYSASDALAIWKEVLPIVFKTNWLRIVGQYVGAGAKYPNSGIESVLKQYLGDTIFRDHIGRVMCPAVVTDLAV